MNIAGYNPNSFVDYPDNIAAVVFISGCNLDCWYCHNKWIIDKKKNYEKEDILTKIKNNKDFLDAVVITGGEPTLAPINELIEFVQKIKSFGLKVKLDTNGTNYEKLKLLLPYLDYVAMDIKAPLEKYDTITKTSATHLENIKKSIDLLINNIDCEFRTTFVPSLLVEDILAIARSIKGCKKYFLQQYVPISEYQEIMSHPSKYLQEVCERLISEGYPCSTRGI